MKKQELQEAILADVLDELGKVYQSVNDLPSTLQKATETLTAATKGSEEYAKSLQKTADTVAASSVEKTKVQLAEAVSKTVEIVAHNTSRKSMLQWAAGSVVASVVSFAVFGYLMFSMGWDGGHQTGYQGGRNDAILAKEYEKDACTWFNTEEGQMAIGLYKAGSLRNLYTCDKPGWVIEERKEGLMCVPKLDTKTKITWGWQLPNPIKPEKTQTQQEPTSTQTR